MKNLQFITMAILEFMRPSKVVFDILSLKNKSSKFPAMFTGVTVTPKY